MGKITLTSWATVSQSGTQDRDLFQEGCREITANAPSGLAMTELYTPFFLFTNVAAGAEPQPNCELVIHSLVGSKDNQLLNKSRSWPAR